MDIRCSRDQRTSSMWRVGIHKSAVISLLAAILDWKTFPTLHQVVKIFKWINVVSEADKWWCFYHSSTHVAVMVVTIISAWCIPRKYVASVKLKKTIEKQFLLLHYVSYNVMLNRWDLNPYLLVSMKMSRLRIWMLLAKNGPRRNCQKIFLGEKKNKRKKNILE